MEIEAAKRQLRKLEAAEGYLLLGMAQHSLRELNAIRDCCEFSFDWYSLKGEACRQLGQFDQALDAFQLACEQRPDDVRVLSGMAWCYKRIDQLHRAIAVAEEAYQANPTQAVLLYNLSCYYALADDKPQALSWLGRALRMDSSLCHCVPHEPDFDGLRNDTDFQFIVAAADGIDQ
jgi:tetratricopeptide (TPR) repeat protein